MKRKPTPAQIAARERFAEMARSGAFKKKAKRNPAKKTVSQKISQLTREGYPQKQAVAIALSEERAGKVKRNPSDLNVAQTILGQLGGNRFIAMTGAKDFIGGSQFLGFKIPRNMSQANRVTITYAPSRDLYTMSFIKTARSGFDTKEVAKFEDVYADQLRSIFTQVTGMETSLGTMGRRSNPRAANPIVLVTDRKPSKRKSNPQAPSAKSRGSIANPNYRYAVQAGKFYTPGQKTMSFVNVAGFPTKAQAQDYIDALLKTYPKGLTLRIMESKVE